MSWRLVYTSQARRDAKKVARSGLKPQAERLLEILAEDPYQTPPPYERLLGDLTGACSPDGQDPSDVDNASGALNGLAWRRDLRSARSEGAVVRT